MNNYSDIGFFIVYKATNKTNGKCYIGITKRDLKDRIYRHNRESQNKESLNYNTPFKRAIRKYGTDGFEWCIIESDLTKHQALEREQYYIKKYKTYFRFKNSNGYNATVGGECIATPKDLISCVDIRTGKILITSNSTEILHFTGCRSSSQIYDVCNHKNNYVKNYIVFWDSEICNLTTAEILHKIRTRLNVIVQLDFNYKIINYFITEKEASIKCNLSQGNINSVISQNRVSTGGYIFMKYNDYIAGKKQRQRSTKEIKVKAVNIKTGDEYVFKSLTELSEKLGLCLSCISQCIKGKRAQTRGYKIFKIIM